MHCQLYFQFPNFRQIQKEDFELGENVPFAGSNICKSSYKMVFRQALRQLVQALWKLRAYKESEQKLNYF